MENYILIIFVGFLYVLLFGGSSLLRRERLSGQFAFEATVLTLLFAGLSYTRILLVNPVIFLIVLYLVTMRVRLLVDAANMFAKRGQYRRADQLYDLAERLWPDATGRLVLWVNRGTSLVVRNNLDEAISVLKDVIGRVEEGDLGIKYEAAAHYNLGVAYLKKEMPGMANREFNAVLDTWPGSAYADRAQAAIDRSRQANRDR